MFFFFFLHDILVDTSLPYISSYLVYITRRNVNWCITYTFLVAETDENNLQRKRESSRMWTHNTTRFN